MKVVNLSSLINIKGIEYFMLSYDFLRNKKSISCQIYGDGPLRVKLESLQNSTVNLMGFTKNSEEIIIKSDVIVVSSIIPESFSLVAVEAFKYGKPVIATSIGGQAEIVVDHEVGLHCFPKNPQSLAEKIDLLYENNGRTLSQLIEGLDMTRQSATQHLDILEAANLISTVKRGREKLHFINPVPLHDVYERWVRKFEHQRLSLLYQLKNELEGEKE